MGAQGDLVSAFGHDGRICDHTGYSWGNEGPDMWLVLYRTLQFIHDCFQPRKMQLLGVPERTQGPHQTLRLWITGRLVTGNHGYFVDLAPIRLPNEVRTKRGRRRNVQFQILDGSLDVLFQAVVQFKIGAK